MTISFVCIATSMPLVNTAVFVTDDGDVVIDRDRTEYTYDATTGLLVMDWVDAYIWNGAFPCYNIPDDFERRLVLKELEVEDDAPADYEIKCIRCYVNGKEIPAVMS